MSVESSIDTEKRIIRVTATGMTGTLDWQRCFSALKDDDRREDDMNVLLDFREHKSVVPSATALSLIDRVEKKTRPVKWAFLVSRSVSVGMVNLVSIYLQTKGIEARAFRDQQQAENWLLADDLPTG